MQRMSLTKLLQAFDKGEISERCLSYLLAIYALDYLELRSVKPIEDPNEVLSPGCVPV